MRRTKRTRRHLYMFSDESWVGEWDELDYEARLRRGRRRSYARS